MADPPLLVVRSHLAGRWLWAAFGLGGLAFAGAGATAMLARSGAAPVPALVVSHPAAFLGAVVGVTFLLVLAVVTHALRRAGTAELHADRVVLRKPGLAAFVPVGPARVAAPDELVVELPWSEVLGFRDGSADYVRLVARRTAVVELTIPTPTEAERAAVLAHLVGRGLARVEG